MLNQQHSLKDINAHQQRALYFVFDKMQKGQVLKQEDLGLFGCFDHVPAKYLVKIFSINEKMHNRMTKAIAEVGEDELGMVYLPSVLDTYIRISIDQDRPANLFDLLEE